MKKKGSPGGGRERRAEQFAYTPTPPGIAKAWTATAAAEPYWCTVHEHTKATPGTKVCVDWYTDGALICPRCKPSLVPTTVAYVPVWREIDHKPCLVIVHETAADLLAGVAFGVRVLIGCVERGSSVFVRATDEQPRWASENPLRQQPADLSTTLYTLWGYTQLWAWSNTQDAREPGREKVSVRDLPEVSDNPVSLPHDRLAALFNESAKKLDQASDRARKSAEWVEEQKKVSTNGKHKPAGGTGHA
jgi:hypothetical protein